VIPVHYIRYDTGRFPIAAAAGRVLGAERLDLLAEAELARKRRAGSVPARLGYDDNMRLRARLAALPPGDPVRRIYTQIVQRVVAPAFGGHISYTATPTFRVHMAGTPSISDWHRDADVTRRLDYLTAWLPFVDTEESCGLWLEGHYGKEDYRPVPVAYGEIVVFDGGLARHGSQPNRTSVSRVSLDFRFTPKPADGRAPVAEMLLAQRPPPPYDLKEPS
jgi:hypothetical protein